MLLKSAFIMKEIVFLNKIEIQRQKVDLNFI